MKSAHVTEDQPALELAAQPKQELATQERNAGMQAAGVLEFIERASRDPNFDIAKFERLLAMQREVMAEQREAEFNDSLARVQAEMPQMEQNGLISYPGRDGKPATRIPFSKLEDIDEVIRPMYSAEGFSVTWNSKPIMDGKLIEVTGIFRHRSGHKEALSIALGPDDSGGKNNVQARASTVSYAKRHLIKMFFHIIERGADKDGSTQQKITREQADTLRSKLEEVEANIAGFCELMEVDTLENLMQTQLDEAYRAIEKKKAQRATKGGARR